MEANLNDVNLEMTVEELTKDTRMGKPHVVILGAGASRQAFPDGDNNVKGLPLMSDFVETLELDDVMTKYKIEYKEKNFEEIYSNLCTDMKYNRLVEEINDRVWDYFSSLKLPPAPTLYDHLVLSLREKDLIATFNWDPFLYYACWRNQERVGLPHIVYLHGNVAVGYCQADMTKGWIGSKCSKCGKKFTPSKLLYPIRQKNYAEEPFIKDEWEALKSALGHAYMLTIFGYNAPQSDEEAMKLMKDAWGNAYSRELEQTEIIDIEPEKELRNKWSGFIHTHHYNTTNDFYKSSIGLFPRRSCEAEWNSSMECRFLKQNPIPIGLGFPELWEWYAPLIQVESGGAA